MKTPWVKEEVDELNREIFRQKWLRQTPSYCYLDYRSLQLIIVDLVLICGGLKFRTWDWEASKIVYVERCLTDSVLNGLIARILKENCISLKINPVIKTNKSNEFEQVCNVEFIGSDNEIQEFWYWPSTSHNILCTALKLYAHLNLATRDLVQEGEFEWHFLDHPELKVKIEIQVEPSSVVFRTLFRKKPIDEKTEIITVKITGDLSEAELLQL